MNTNNGWQDIASAPKDGSRFIALGPIPVHGSVEVRETYWSFFGEGSIAKAMFERGEGPSGNWSWEEPMNNWVSSWRPTHWMPLPAAPGSPTEQPAYTVTVDPDPRGVSVGVYQGSSCVYHGAHPIPASTVADEGAKDERAPEWMTCESRRPWVTNSLKANAQELRDKERRCRTAYNKDFYGIPARYVADVYAEAAAVFEAKLAALSASQQGGE